MQPPLYAYDTEETALYQQNDWADNHRQFKRRLWTLLIPEFLFLTGVIVSILPGVRLQWLTILLTILGGGLAIFCYGLFISPIVSYGRHLKNVLDGRKKEVTGRLTEIGSQSCIREGVEYYPITVNIGEKGDQADDRLFYYDAHKGIPPFEPGDMVTVTSHDKAVAEIRRAE
jgi:hypothetical protein